MEDTCAKCFLYCLHLDEAFNKMHNLHQENEDLKIKLAQCQIEHIIEKALNSNENPSPDHTNDWTAFENRCYSPTVLLKLFSNLQMKINELESNQIKINKSILQIEHFNRTIETRENLRRLFRMLKHMDESDRSALIQEINFSEPSLGLTSHDIDQMVKYRQKLTDYLDCSENENVKKIEDEFSICKNINGCNYTIGHPRVKRIAFDISLVNKTRFLLARGYGTCRIKL